MKQKTLTEWSKRPVLMGLKDERDCAPGVRVHGSGEGASQKLSMGHAGSPRPRGLQPLGLCHCDLQRQKGGLRGRGA